MVARSELRKEAYQYILQILRNLPSTADKEKWSQCIPLEELRLVKEGIADPSPAIVASLKSLIGGAVSETAINAHLVKPFENPVPE